MTDHRIDDRTESRRQRGVVLKMCSLLKPRIKVCKLIMVSRSQLMMQLAEIRYGIFLGNIAPMGRKLAWNE